MKKRLNQMLVLIAVFMLAFTLAGCGDNGDPSSPPVGTPQTIIYSGTTDSGPYPGTYSLKITENLNRAAFPQSEDAYELTYTGAITAKSTGKVVSFSGNVFSLLPAGEATPFSAGISAAGLISLSGTIKWTNGTYQIHDTPLTLTPGSTGGNGDQPSPGTEIATRYRAESRDVYGGGASIWYGTQYWSYSDVTVHADSLVFYTAADFLHPDITINGASTNGGTDIYNDLAGLGLSITTGRWDYLFEGNDIIGFMYDYTVTNNGTPFTITRGFYIGDNAIIQAPLLSAALFLDIPINADFIQSKSQSGYDASFTDSEL